MVLGAVEWLDELYVCAAMVIVDFFVRTCHTLVAVLYLVVKAHGWVDLGKQLRESGYAILGKAHKYGFKVPTIAVILAYIKRLIFGNEYDQFNRILYDYTFNRGVGSLTMVIANLKLLTIGCNYNNKDYILYDYLFNGSKNVTRCDVTHAYINY